MSKLVSVIVLNWNGKHHINDCLSSLARQTYQDMEVILVDNGSTDGSITYVYENFPWVRVIALPNNQGFCGGNNRGIEQARGEYIALLNNDTEVEEDWLEKLFEVISGDNTIAACDSKVFFFDQRDTIWSAGAEYTIAGTVQMRGYLQKDRVEFQQLRDVFVAVACSAIYRKSVFDEIGLLDEDFFAGYEDVDWSFRAHLRGYRIVNVPTSRVYHKVSATHKYNSDDYVYNGQKNVTAVFLKNMPNTLFYKYLPFHIFYIIGSFFYFLKIGKKNALIKAKRNILKQLPILLYKRRSIQNLMTISDRDIDVLLSKNWLNSKVRKWYNK